MFIKEIILTVCLFQICLIHAIPKVDTIKLNSNLKEFNITGTQKSIYFFCPINSTSEELYLEKFNLLYRKKKIQIIDSLNFCIVFFNAGTNLSKGIKVKIKGHDPLEYINDFSCIFENFSQRELEIHASRNEMLKYYITEFYNGTSSVNVKLKEDIACYSSLAERIPNYENYISQLFKPVYSELELIQSLKDSLGFANQQIKELQNSLKSQSEDLSNFKERIEQLEKNSKNQQPIDNKPQAILRNFLIRSKNE